jgi:hypothetical protein
MWRIDSRRSTLQEVLIMAYMNALEAKSCPTVVGRGGAEASYGEPSSMRASGKEFLRQMI